MLYGRVTLAMVNGLSVSGTIKHVVAVVPGNHRRSAATLRAGSRQTTKCCRQVFESIQATELLIDTYFADWLVSNGANLDGWLYSDDLSLCW